MLLILKMAQSLGKYIGLIFLMVFAKTWIDKQEITEAQEAIPQTQHMCFLQSEQPITQRTIAHLYSEQIAISIYALGEIPGYQSQSSKHTSSHTVNRMNRHRMQIVPLEESIHSSAFIRHHVIDYYIYTLEHILI